MDADPMPRSTEEVLENLRILYAQRIRQRARVPDIIVEAYRAAWALFYSWEPAYSRHVLHGLQSPAVEVPTSTFDNSLENQLEDFNSITVDSDPSLTFTVWSANFEHRSRSLEPHCVLLSSPSVTTFAYPKYESCAPATRNIFHGRDQGLLEFIQYADEPGFYSTLYARQHNCFAWQTAWHDVDHKLIALHAAWSLRTAGLSPKAIDEYKIRFFPTIVGCSGLLATLQNRDFIDWGTAVPSQQFVELRDASQKAIRRPGSGLWSSVSTLNSLFCRSTNCIEGLCMLHKAPKPPLKHARHRKTNEEFLEGTRPCGPKCYRAVTGPVRQDDDDIMEIQQDICDMLKLFPDAPICKLAILCNADCRDVYYHRIMYLPKRNSFIPEVDVDVYASQSGTVQYQTDTCHHDGPCVPPACICAVRQRWCNRRCGCPVRCATRKGCTCEDGKCLDLVLARGDYDKVCPCILAEWECSPELCAGVRNKRLKKTVKHTCKHMQLQKDKKPPIQVKQATYGLGAFATGKISAGTFLGEYVAELLPPATDERIDRAQSKVNRHRGLNYMFNLNYNNGILDAATVGDPTRCLNDSIDEDALNVKAESITVDGDVRIYFCAFKDVKKNEELLLSYGRGYWEHHDTLSSDEERFDAEFNADHLEDDGTETVDRGLGDQDEDSSELLRDLQYPD